MKVFRKKFLVIYVLINFFLLFAGGLKILTVHQEDVCLKKIPLYDWWGEFDTNNYFSWEFPSSKYLFLAEADILEKGIYNITVNYKTNSNHFYLYCESDVDGNKYPAVYADDYLLDPGKNSLSFQVWVNDKIDFLKVCIDCGETSQLQEGSYLRLEKIEIVRNFSGSACYSFLKLIFLLCVLNGILIIYWTRDKIKNNFYVIFGLSLIFLVSSLEIFTNSQVLGHDLVFHLGRIIGLKEGMGAGNFPVRIQLGWFNDYGYAASIFYGDILLYIPAILYALKVPLVYVYKIYLLIVNLGTLLISYYTFKRISKDRYIGIVCTAFYCLSINRILNVYLRAAVGEYSAFMFLPLIVLGLWNILTSDSKPKNYRYSWILLCLAMTGVIQTHTLSFEMVGVFLVLVCLILIKKVLQKEVFWELCKAGFITICLNLSFLLPFLDYAREDLKVFSEKAAYGIQHYGLSLYELLSIGTSAAGQALDSAKGLKNRFPETLGLTMLIVLMTIVVLLFKQSDWGKREKKQLVYVSLFSLISIYLSTYYFPWNKIADIKLFQNVVSSIQFPWRFVSLAVPLLTLSACLILKHLKTAVRADYMKVIMIGLCVLAAYQGLQYMDIIARGTKNYVKYDGSYLLDVKETSSGGEYLYKDTDLELTLKDMDVTGENLQALRMDKVNNQADIWCIADKNAYVEVPIFAYPYYQCKDMDTGEIYPITRGNNNKIRVDLPDNYSGNLRISFKEPWHWRMAEAVSVLTGIFLAIYIFRIKRINREAIIKE